MSQTVARVIKRRGALPAFLAALGIFIALLVQGFLSSIFGTLSVLAAASIDGDFFGRLWAAQLASSVGGSLPMAIGVFFCFWQIAPIASPLRLAHVVTRALLAAVVGAVLLFAVAVAYWGLLVVLGGLGVDLSGWIPPVGDSALVILFRSLTTLVAVVPLVVLGAVLLWGWLQRHPLDYEVRGTLDEV